MFRTRHDEGFLAVYDSGYRINGPPAAKKDLTTFAINVVPDQHAMSNFQYR